MSTPRRTAGDRPPVPEGVRAAAAWAWRLLALGAALVAVALLVARLSLVTAAFAAALLLAAALQPLAARLIRAGVPGAAAAWLVLLGFLAVVGLAGWFIGRAVAAELADLRESLAEGVDQVRDWLVDAPLPVGDRPLGDVTQGLIDWVMGSDGAPGSGIVTAATTATTVLTTVVLALFILFFLLYDGRRIWAWVVRLLPSQAREPVDGAGQQAWSTLVSYVHGLVVVALSDALLVALALSVLGVPLVAPLAALTFFGAFVPLIGAAIAGSAAVLVALVDEGLTTALVLAVAVLVIQWIDGDVLHPIVVGRAVRVHPLAVGLAVAVGSLLWGIVGAVVAVPLVAATNTAVVHLTRARDEQREAAETAGRAPTE